MSPLYASRGDSKRVVIGQMNRRVREREKTTWMTSKMEKRERERTRERKERKKRYSRRKVIWFHDKGKLYPRVSLWLNHEDRRERGRVSKREREKMRVKEEFWFDFTQD